MTADAFAWSPSGGARIAIVAGDAEITYAELGARVSAARRGLSALGFEPGARVALRGTNTVDTIAVILGAERAGIAIAPLHPRLTASETEDLLADLGADLVLDDQRAVELASGPTGGLGPPPDGDADLALVHTSGTTARPKIARLARSAFVASAAASAANLGWSDADRWLLCLPVCHVGGLSVVTRCTIAGAGIVLLPKFEAEATLEAIARHGATLLSVVPTMLRALLDADTGGVLSRLRAVLLGGAAAPPPMLEECERRGVVALTTYGLTEACSQLTAQAPPRAGQQYRAEPGSGRPLPGVELRIAGEDGEPANTGEPGRILVRGPTRMRGYLGHPELGLDAWLDTGDVGALDELGRLHVEARRSDLIVTGGENVSPAEVERALVAAGAREALVLGVPDERWGQIVAALVVADRPLDPAKLASDLEKHLAPHKRPRRWAQIDSLPVNRLGKPDRGLGLARHAGVLGRLVYGSGG